jgi:hypothetical protein
LDANTLIDTLFHIAEKNGGKLLGVAADSAARLKKYLEVNFSDYFYNTIARCSNVTTLFDRSKPISLISIYVRTRFEFSGAKVSEGALREKILSLPAGDSVRIFLIIGAAGRGKTFFLRWLFLSLLENQEAKIPFYIELRGINLQAEVNLPKYLFEAITSRRAKLSFEQFDSGMEEGNFIIILDGLDEVQRDKRDILSRQLMTLQDRCPNLITIVSSRHDGNLSSWTRARRYYVLPMDKRDAVSLIRKLPYKSDVKKRFSGEVESTLYDRHTSFLSNPLLVTIMLLTYADIGSVPAKMHIFYEQAFETLFYRHDTWKEAGYQRKHYSDVPVNEFRDCLSSFCISSYQKSQYEFTTSAALDLIQKAATFEGISLNAADFLKDLEESICILLLDGLTFTFTHRSFQEYFSAYFISRAPPVALQSLLDDLVAHRGDVVIPMAFDMNRNLIESEWIRPHLAELVDEGGSEPLPFIRKVARQIIYDGSIGEFGAIVFERGGGGHVDFLLALSQLYPEFTPHALTDLTLCEGDQTALREKWNQVRDEWWERIQRESPSDTAMVSESASNFSLYVQRALVKGYRSNPLLSGKEPAEQRWAELVRVSDQQFGIWRQGTWGLTDEDVGWLAWTSYFDKIVQLEDQLIALRKSLGLSAAKFRQAGQELFSLQDRRKRVGEDVYEDAFDATVLGDLVAAGLVVRILLDLRHNTNFATYRPSANLAVIRRPIKLDVEVSPGTVDGQKWRVLQSKPRTSNTHKFYNTLTEAGGLTKLRQLGYLKVEVHNFDRTIADLPDAAALADPLQAVTAPTPPAFNALAPYVRQSMGMYLRGNSAIDFVFQGAREAEPRTA